MNGKAEALTEQVSFSLRGRNPDVLTCIANLSNDEVFTPPEFANRMLDTLAEAWAASHNGASSGRSTASRCWKPCQEAWLSAMEKVFPCPVSRISESFILPTIRELSRQSQYSTRRVLNRMPG